MQDPVRPPFGIKEHSSPAPAVESKALPLEWLLAPKENTLTDRVLAELVRAEAHEANPHFKDDYRQAFIVVSLAAEGNPIPFVESSYKCYGLHPDKLWPAMVARRQALLGTPRRMLSRKVLAEPRPERKRA